MRDKHIFSKSYLDRKEAVLHALRREEAEAQKSKTAQSIRQKMRFIKNLPSIK